MDLDTNDLVWQCLEKESEAVVFDAPYEHGAWDSDDAGFDTGDENDPRTAENDAEPADDLTDHEVWIHTNHLTPFPLWARTENSKPSRDPRQIVIIHRHSGNPTKEKKDAMLKRGVVLVNELCQKLLGRTIQQWQSLNAHTNKKSFQNVVMSTTSFYKTTVPTGITRPHTGFKSTRCPSRNRDFSNAVGMKGWRAGTRVAALFIIAGFDGWCTSLPKLRRWRAAQDHLVIIQLVFYIGRGTRTGFTDLVDLDELLYSEDPSEFIFWLRRFFDWSVRSRKMMRRSNAERAKTSAHRRHNTRRNGDAVST